MAQRFIDSFDHYAVADITKKWTALASGGGGATATIVTGRNGNCVNLDASFGSSATLTKVLDNQATWIVGAAVKYPALVSADRSIFMLLDGANPQLNVQTVTGGFLCVTRNGTVLGTSTLSIVAGVFYYIELKTTINNTTGSYELRVNGVNWVSGSGVDTQATANAFANTIQINTLVSNSVTQYDDLYIFDGTGSHDNDFAGDIVISCSLANAAGDLSDWTPSAGSNYQNVDDNPNDGDTTYNASNTVGQKDLFNFTNLSGAATAILGIQRTIVARKDDAGTRLIKPIYKGGGTIYSGTAVALATGYLWYTDTLELDPATSAPWSTSGVNAGQFGVELDT